jgi:hypothetical protein
MAWFNPSVVVGPVVGSETTTKLVVVGLQVGMLPRMVGFNPSVVSSVSSVVGTDITLIVVVVVVVALSSAVAMGEGVFSFGVEGIGDGLLDMCRLPCFP